MANGLSVQVMHEFLSNGDIAKDIAPNNKCPLLRIDKP